MAVNGRTAELGDRIDGSERIFVDGKPVRLPTAGRNIQQEHIAYYKPVGEVTTRADPQGRRTVFEDLPKPRRGRWVTVGRLDISTSGLLLLTTDGELAHRLMHPSYEVSRTYAVRLLGELSDEQTAQLLRGVSIDGQTARFDEIRRSGGSGSNTWYEVSLREGRNREVRRLFDALRLTVSRLIRIQYGPIKLTRLSRGQWRQLTPAEIRQVYAAVGLE